MHYPVTTFAHEGTEVATASATIATANAKRTYLIIRNQGGVSVFLRFDGATAVADKTSLELQPNDSVEPWPMPASSVTAICAAGNTCDVHAVSGGPPLDDDVVINALGDIVIDAAGDTVLAA